jgi:lipopolysaccharide transport system permease protein
LRFDFGGVTYLMLELARKDIKGRYKGSMLGIWWAALTPMAMLFVFTFVFGEIFRAKWHTGGGMVEYGLNLYAGLIVFWFFAEVIGRSPTFVSSQPNFVTKVVFPLEILPLAPILSALFHLGINFIILCAGAWLFKGFLPLSIVALPFVILSTLPLLAGIGWTLSAVGVYVRDIASVIGVLMNMLMFLSPVFYPLEAVPQGFRVFFELNPMSFVIESVRNGVMNGAWVSVGGLALYSCVSLVVGALGYRCFQALRDGFADVL